MVVGMATARIAAAAQRRARALLRFDSAAG
jgi:hypothetical protein